MTAPAIDPEAGFAAVRDVLIGGLVAGRSALLGGAERTGGGELELIDEILEGLQHEDARRLAEGSADGLGAWLAGLAANDGERRAALADVVGLIARRIAPVGSEAPSAGAEGEAWQMLATAVDLLYGGGACAVGRLPFIGPKRLAELAAEARRQLPERSESGERIAAGAGPALADLAVSRQLREAVSDAFGFAVAPTYGAVYMYDPPGSHVPTHVDRRSYELVFHMTLEHEPADGSDRSALVVHPVGELGPTRLLLAPGEGVALRGRGTIHSWEPLGESERRTLIGIGFERRAAAG